MPSSTTRHSSPPVNAAPSARVNGTARRPSVRKMERFLLLVLGCLCVSPVTADSLSPPVNVTIKAVKANSAVVTWDIPEGDPVIGFAITQQTGNDETINAALGSDLSHVLLQQKKDVRMLRFIQEVNISTLSCASWELEEETDYIVHVQSISMSGMSPLSEPLRFRTPKEAETQASKSKGEVAQRENTQTRKYEHLLSHPAHPHTRPSTQEPSLGCVVSPLLYSLYTPDCMAPHSSNLLVKFADDTTAIG
ncbi:fibronectin type III domain-containing protein 5b-like isoform X1 [Chaetodon auriga]|uniref:fibronectin type III domain-containing protein 5b-like isoform X1 n=1 Tax=Chaetodon auriga TaxID=39042 RepID=UPI004032F7BF